MLLHSRLNFNGRACHPAIQNSMILDCRSDEDELKSFNGETVTVFNEDGDVIATENE